MDDSPEDLTSLVRKLNESIQPAKGSQRPARGGDAHHDPLPAAGRLDELLAAACDRGASDLLFVAGVPPVIRVDGALIPIEAEPLSAAETRAISLLLLDEVRYREFQRSKAADFVFDRAGVGRFRCDLHYQQGSIALAIRVLPAVIPTIEALNLPPSYARFAHLARGLVLFCGPTGCGKSTTMAALVGLINRTRAAHIVTIEDPIEYVHTHDRSVVEQVEVGHDSPTFASALRHALRQNPDIVQVGEMRDLETMQIALTAAETGHLVMSTLHTSDAAQTVDRIIDSFPEDQQNQVRQQLSLSLAGIAVQTLVPRADGKGRLPACEILLANDPVRHLIRSSRNHLLYSHITMGRREGMTTMEESLAELVRSGRIRREEALLRASHREELEKLLV